ncbi:putative acetyltransferase EpsM [compost metagenome]
MSSAVHISPGARLAGGVKVGEQSWIGIGSCVRQLVNIGRFVIVGAGAAVVDDIPDGMTVVGIPARQLVK